MLRGLRPKAIGGADSKDLRLLRPEAVVCQEIHNAGSGCARNEVIPEVIERGDRLGDRAGTAVFWCKAIPDHQPIERAGRGPAQAHEFDLPLPYIFEDLEEHTDLESSMHSSTLTGDGHFRDGRLRRPAYSAVTFPYLQSPCPTSTRIVRTAQWAPDPEVIVSTILAVATCSGLKMKCSISHSSITVTLLPSSGKRPILKEVNSVT